MPTAQYVLAALIVVLVDIGVPSAPAAEPGPVASTGAAVNLTERLDYWHREYVTLKTRMFNDVVYNQFRHLNGSVPVK